MTPLVLFFGWLTLPTAIGHVVLRLQRIPLSNDRLSAIAWSWMSGALITAFSVFLQSVTFGIGRTWTMAAILLWIVALLGGIAAVGRRQKAAPETLSNAPASSIEDRGTAALICDWAGISLLCLSLWLIVGYAAEANTAYILSGDELFIWKAKARAIYAAGGLNGEFAEVGTGKMSPFPVEHADYPLLNPLLQLLVFIASGRVTHWESRIPMQVAMAVLVVALFAALRRRPHPLIAGLITFLFAASPWTDQLSGLAYSDHLVALGFFVAVDAVMRAAETGRREYHRLTALGFAFSLAAKNEGALLLGAAIGASLIATFLERRGSKEIAPERRPPAVALLLPGAVVAIQWAVNRRFGLANDLWEGKDGQPFYLLAFRQWSSHARTVAEYFGAAFLTVLPPWKLAPEIDTWWIRRTRHFTMIPPTLLLALIALRPPLRGTPLFRPLLAVLFAVLGYMFIYIGTPRPLVWHLTTSMFRVLFTIYPTIALLLGTILGGVFPPATRRVG